VHVQTYKCDSCARTSRFLSRPYTTRAGRSPPENTNKSTREDSVRGSVINTSMCMHNHMSVILERGHFGLSLLHRRLAPVNRSLERTGYGVVVFEKDHTCTYIHTYIHIYIHMHIYLYLLTSLYIQVSDYPPPNSRAPPSHIYICIGIYIIYMYINLYLHIHIYLYVDASIYLSIYNDI